MDPSAPVGSHTSRASLKAAELMLHIFSRVRAGARNQVEHSATQTKASAVSDHKS